MTRSLKSLRPFVLGLLIVTAVGGYITSSLAQKDPSKKTYTAPDSKGSKKESNPTVIKTTKEDISLSEFEAAYRRMNDKDPYGTTLDSLKDFLGIYADYRLKLLEAKEMKIDQDPKIQKEIEGYRTMLAGPFILDKEITEPNVQKVWDRRQWEVDAAHYLAATKGNNPADTLRAYKRALQAIEKLNNGETMSEIVISARDMEFVNDTKKAFENEREKKNKGITDSSAWQGSDDKSSAKNGGEIGWFTGGQTVRPFEDAVYSLKPGQYTKTPVRTRYGYHVIMLLDKHPRLGGLRVHHILVNMNKSITGKDTLQFYQKADSLLRLIKGGAKFEDIARQASDDKFTAARGGDMDFINREERRTEPTFDKTAYGLKDGEISGVIRTSKGYHIIRRDGTLPTKSYDQEKDALKKLYKQYYFNDDRAQRLSEVRKQSNEKINQSALNIFMSRVDSTRTTLDSTWAKKITPGEKNLELYGIGGKSWNVASLIDSLSAQPGTPLARGSVLDMINKNLDDEAVNILAKDVSKRYPEFDNIMADYQNGITLFELENKRIWSKVLPDSVKEKKFYDEHKARFMWPERIDVSEIYVYNDSVAKELYKKIINGENFDTLAKKFTERPGFKEKAGHWGLLTRDENEMSKKAFGFTADDVKEPFPFQSGFSIVKLNRRVPIAQKSFDEARQEVASLYQDELSNELRLDWVTELRKKYKLQINTKLIEESWKSHHTAGSTIGYAPSGDSK
jgi:peptidyl-prolyl cis-trans isomerase SurA